MAIVVAGVLVASVTRLIRRYHDAMPGGSEPEAFDAVPSGGICRLLPSSASTRLPFAALCASAAAQAGGVAGFTGHAVAGAALVAISAAVVAWYSGATRGSELQRSRAAQSMFRVTLMVALAASFTAGGLMQYLTVHHGLGWGSAEHSRNILVNSPSIKSAKHLEARMFWPDNWAWRWASGGRNRLPSGWRRASCRFGGATLSTVG